MTDGGQRSGREADELRYTHSFLEESVRRGELHPLSFDLMARRIDARLGELGEPPLTPAVAAPAVQPAETFPDLPAERAAAPSQVHLGPVFALYLGAFLLFMSAIAFTAYGWQDFADELKFVIIAAYDLVLFGISVMVERTKLRQAALTFFWLGAATLPVAVGALGSFVLSLEMSEAGTVGNEWLAFLMAGTAAGTFGLYAWKRIEAFRVISLAALAMAPFAYFLNEGDLVPVIPAAVAVAYTAAAMGVREEGWARAAKIVAIVAAVPAVFLAVGSVAEHLGREVTAVQTTASSDPATYTATVTVALLAVLAYLWRSAKWADTAVPEAVLGSVLATLLLTAWQLGGRADGLGLLYALALLPAAVYVGMKRFREAVAAVPFPLLAVLLLTPGSTYERIFSPATAPSQFTWNGLLLGVALLGLGDLYGHSAWYRKVPPLKMAQPAVGIGAAALYALLAAALPPGDPWLALGMTAVAGVLAFLAFRLRAPGFAVPAASLAVVSFIAVMMFVGGDGVPRQADWGWLAAFLGILTVSALAISVDAGRPLPSSLPPGFLAALTLLPALVALDVELSPWYFLGLAAVALLWAALYRFDLYAVAGVLLLSTWGWAYLEEGARDLDNGYGMLLMLPAFVLGWWLWRKSEGLRWRTLARSACLVVVPLLALGSLRAGSYLEGYALFVAALAASAAFAVVGFARRIAGFAGVGVVFLFWTSFEFLAPYIELIPSWVGFAVVGLLLVGVGIWWERGRVYITHKAKELSRGWV